MSFDRLAPHYRWLERVLAGHKLQRCRTTFLSRISHSKQVLLMGEGNGRFLVECRRAAPSARIVYVDASRRMLRLAQKRLEHAGVECGEVEFIHADALEWRPPQDCFDVVVTHFFLDCFASDQLAGIIERLERATTPGALWLLADFQVPRTGFFRWRAQMIHQVMYGFFRLATGLPADRLTPPDELLQRHGFELQHRYESEWGLLHSDLWQRCAEKS